MITIAQRWRGVTPAAIVAHRGGAEHGGAIRDGDRTARFTAAAQGWRVGVGAAAFRDRHTRTIFQRHAGWRGGHHGINGDVDGWRIGLHAGRRVSGDRMESVSRIGQRRRCEVPLPIATRDRAANDGGAVIQRDQIARARLAAKNRRGVVSAGVVWQFNQRAAAVVGHHQQAAGRRNASIDIEGKYRRRRANIACRIGDGGGQAVLAVSQRGIWREAPATVAARCR